MSHAVPDPIADGLASGWLVKGGAFGALPTTIECDVAIIGSGAGAGISAELLSAAGLRVVIIEEGPLRSSRDFRQRESEAYPTLYQESAARKTADKAITILQGRCVGGSTTVNWTSSFRTPSATLAYWRDRFGLSGFTDAALAPYFLRAEQRLSIGPWLAPPNANNDLLRQGALKLGIAAAAILRNVKGCWNLGSCGLGCPTNAKQSMLVTTLPVALDRGATLIVETRAERFEMAQGRIAAVWCQPVLPNGAPQQGAAPTRVVARHFVLAAGAINSPAVLMRSRVPDPHGRLGVRTFLHPVVLSAATFAQQVAGWEGAPQTIYSDHYLDVDPIDGPIGFKLEAPPLHPLIFTTSVGGFGRSAAAAFARFPQTHAVLALLRDGFHPESPGGRVRLRGDGSPELDYPLTPFVMDGARRALRTMAEIQFAAGADTVYTGHELAPPLRSMADARRVIEALPMEPLWTKVVSAHVMGGCAMGKDPSRSVVDARLRHHGLDNLWVVDGSVLPTSLGVNPHLTISALAHRAAEGIAAKAG